MLSIDLLRLLAAVQMVQGHTIAALLEQSARHGPIYRTWLTLRGLTAVAFLLASGMAFQLATLRDLEAHRRDRERVRKRFVRALHLVLLGYLLRFPLPLGGASSFAALLRDALAVDVLQCIGVCLALCEGLTLLLPTALAVEMGCGMVGAAMLGLSPLAARIDAPGPWLPLLDYATSTGGSPFPLMPWGAHMLLGVALARSLLSRGASRLRVLLGALAILLAGHLLVGAAPPVLADHLQRLGGVLLLLWALTLLEPAARRLPPWTWQLSSSTLIVYVAHVWPLYGRRFGLASLVGPTLSAPAAIAVALALLAFSVGSVFAYDRLVAGLAHRTATG